MRKTLSDKGVTALKPRASRYAFPDPELRGHYIRVTPSGAKSFVAVTVDPDGKQVWATLGTCDLYSIAEAREKARETIKRVHKGLPAFEAPPTKAATFEDIAEQWLTRHVRAKGLRSEYEVVRLLKAHIYPAWKGRAFLHIRRSDVTALLDEMEDGGHGQRQTDYVLAIVRGVMNWFATRHDDYVPPIVKGMQRRNAKERARARIFTDTELQLIWKQAEASGTFGALLRLLLLTAQRLDKVVSMRWRDVSIDGEWIIPVEPREKGTAGSLMLPKIALDIIRTQPKLGNNEHVFAGRGDGHINGHSQSKHRFEAALPQMPQWQMHDLRRTARSLMSRAGVTSEHAERVLGHALQGVQGTYDRHSYRNEKADALARLAALLEAIVNPRAENVVAMAKRKRR